MARYRFFPLRLRAAGIAGRGWCGRRYANVRGVAAVEFAIIAPVLVTFCVGLYDLSAAITTWWHLTEAAHAVAQIATISAAQTDQTNSITTTQATTAATAAYPVVPQFATASAANFGVTLTSVVFTLTVSTCTSNCQYTANVAWSMTLEGGAAARSCGTLTAVADSTAPSATTLPTDAFSAAPLLVVDVFYKFTPALSGFITGPIKMTRTAYLAPRTGSNSAWFQLTSPPTSTTICSGY